MDGEGAQSTAERTGSPDNGHPQGKDAAEDSVVITDLDTGKALHVQKVCLALHARKCTRTLRQCRQVASPQHLH